MKKIKVIIILIVLIVGAILFGTLRANRTLNEPMESQFSIEEFMDIMHNEQQYPLIARLQLFNKLSETGAIRCADTGEVYSFTQEELEELYEIIGGKAAYIELINSFEDEEDKIIAISHGYMAGIFTTEEYNELMNQFN